LFEAFHCLDIHVGFAFMRNNIVGNGTELEKCCDDEWIFRQLVRQGAGWRLQALNPAYPAADIAGLDAVKGVIIQKSRPGTRRATKRYVE
jgi:hypothetical protein